MQSRLLPVKYRMWWRSLARSLPRRIICMLSSALLVVVASSCGRFSALPRPLAVRATTDTSSRLRSAVESKMFLNIVVDADGALQRGYAEIQSELLRGVANIEKPLRVDAIHDLTGMRRLRVRYLQTSSPASISVKQFITTHFESAMRSATNGEQLQAVWLQGDQFTLIAADDVPRGILEGIRAFGMARGDQAFEACDLYFYRTSDSGMRPEPSHVAPQPTK